MLMATALAWTVSAHATEPEPDPYILALTRDELRVERLYSEDLSQPLSREALASSEGVVGHAADLLMMWNEDRENDVVSFINDSFVPALLANRDDFVCRRTRAFYADLLQQADAYLSKTGRDSSFRKYAAMCNCLSPDPIRYWWSNDLYYFLMLTWGDLDERKLVVRKWTGNEIANRASVERWMSISYDLSTPCDAPWTLAAAQH